MSQALMQGARLEVNIPTRYPMEIEMRGFSFDISP